MRKLTQEQARQAFPGEPDASRWTAIIPAAGKGTRLGFPKAKILYPLLGRTILDRLIDLLEPRCRDFCFVLSPLAEPDALPILRERLPGRFRAPVLTDSRGMADSIYQAVPRIATPHTLIVWGDQAALSADTIRTVQAMHESIAGAALTLPLAERPQPYTHYSTSPDGRFVGVLEKREGKAMPGIGESDCGVFACDTRRLQAIFAREVERGIVLSEVTREWNFLPLLPGFEAGGASVNAFRLENLEETVGVNDAADVAVLEAYLGRREKVV